MGWVKAKIVRRGGDTEGSPPLPPLPIKILIVHLKVIRSNILNSALRLILLKSDEF